MKKTACLALLLTLLMIVSACAEALTPIPWDAKTSPNLPKKENYLPDQAGYHDDSLDVRVETFRRDDTTVMAVHVTIQDPSQLRTVVMGGTKVAPIAAMAKREHAVLAINGDYYAFHGQGIVVRNGKQLRNRPNPGRDTLIIDDQGDFTILHPSSKESFEAFQGKVMQAFCFGPGLVVDGEALTDLTDLTINNGKSRKTQRMALGQTGPLSYLILTCEGPENKGSLGFDLLQMAQLCKDMGCINAYNMDGGSSCTVVLNNKKINALSSGKVRSISDAVVFDTLVP